MTVTEFVFANAHEEFLGLFCGHESLSIILHCVQILLSVLDPASRSSFLGEKEDIAVAPAKIRF